MACGHLPSISFAATLLPDPLSTRILLSQNHMDKWSLFSFVFCDQYLGTSPKRALKEWDSSSDAIHLGCPNGVRGNS